MIAPRDRGKFCIWTAKLSSRAISSSHLTSPNSSNGRVGDDEADVIRQGTKTIMKLSVLRIIRSPMNQVLQFGSAFPAIIPKFRRGCASTHAGKDARAPLTPPNQQ